jgi:hypothetical protein
MTILASTQGVEDLAIEQLIKQPRIEGFDVAVLPGERVGTLKSRPILGGPHNQYVRT